MAVCGGLEVPASRAVFQAPGLATGCFKGLRGLLAPARTALALGDREQRIDAPDPRLNLPGQRACGVEIVRRDLGGHDAVEGLAFFGGVVDAVRRPQRGLDFPAFGLRGGDMLPGDVAPRGLRDPAGDLPGLLDRSGGGQGPRDLGEGAGAGIARLAFVAEELGDLVRGPPCPLQALGGGRVLGAILPGRDRRQRPGQGVVVRDPGDGCEGSLHIAVLQLHDRDPLEGFAFEGRAADLPRHPERPGHVAGAGHRPGHVIQAVVAVEDERVDQLDGRLGLAGPRQGLGGVDQPVLALGFLGRLDRRLQGPFERVDKPRPTLEPGDLAEQPDALFEIVERADARQGLLQRRPRLAPDSVRRRDGVGRGGQPRRSLGLRAAAR